MMKIYASIAIVSALFLATPIAKAQEVSYLAGVDLTSNYVVNGMSDSNDKPAIQPYFEINYDGFYAGTWMSTVELGTDNVEVDLYAGYRKAFDNGLAFSAGYAHYFYDDTGSCCGEYTLTLAYLVNDFGIDTYTAYNPKSEKFNNRLSAAYAITDDLGVFASYGYKQSTRNEYGHIGVSYAFNDVMSASLRYHNAKTGFDGLVFTLSLANQQESLRRLLLNPSTTR
jgi:uncharacterized protein (TIGR02001 family)